MTRGRRASGRGRGQQVSLPDILSHDTKLWVFHSIRLVVCSSKQDRDRLIV